MELMCGTSYLHPDRISYFRQQELSAIAFFSTYLLIPSPGPVSAGNKHNCPALGGHAKPRSQNDAVKSLTPLLISLGAARAQDVSDMFIDSAHLPTSLFYLPEHTIEGRDEGRMMPHAAPSPPQKMSRGRTESWHS